MPFRPLTIIKTLRAAGYLFAKASAEPEDFEGSTKAVNAWAYSRYGYYYYDRKTGKVDARFELSGRGVDADFDAPEGGYPTVWVTGADGRSCKIGLHNDISKPLAYNDNPKDNEG